MFDTLIRTISRRHISAAATREGATDQLSQLGLCIAERERIHAKAKQETEAIWRVANRRIARLDKRSFSLGRALYRFWITTGHALTSTQTLALDAAGSLKTRIVTGKMELDEARTIGQLKRLGRLDLIEIKETVRIELLEKEPEAFQKKVGVKRPKRTKFYATPSNTDHRVERDPKHSGHWLLALLKR